MRFTSKIVFTGGILLLILAALSLVFNHQGFALKLITFAFWIFVFATIYYLFEAVKKK